MMTRLALLLSLVASSQAVTRNDEYERVMEEHVRLFEHAEEVEVLGPSLFPKPTLLAAEDGGGNVVPHLKPVHGRHRPDADAVIAFAAEYPLQNYMVFIESLRDAGFEGDIVLALSPLDVRKEDVWEYLTFCEHTVLYAPVLTCYNAEGEEVDGVKGGMRLCVSHDLYAEEQEDGALRPLQDPRSGRTVQTLRYEIYWIMSQAVGPSQWILLVDARDTYFQANPFDSVPRQSRAKAQENGGRLYFFGENMDATRLGKSKSNSKWLFNAYGPIVFEYLADKPTICSGATMGEQVALDQYVRAMVAESDSTGVVLAGADQGFHNFLHYSRKLANARAIRSVTVFDQGQGAVNNMGALRTQPLEAWGNGRIVKSQDLDRSFRRFTKRYTVYNWNGSISPVVHQYDRHKELSDYVFKVKGHEYSERWSKQKQQKQVASA